MLQVAWTIVAGLLLFVIVRRTIAQDRVAGMIVAGGLLLRAVAGQAIFWISYLHLPIASHLQIGNGLWFFALDGEVYLTKAIDLSEHGISAIVSAPRGDMSASYIQALSTAVLMLGRSAAVGLLLNLFSYVLTCSVILWWARHSAAMRRPALFALLAITASPAGVLWSFQPLKDTFFQFLVVAFLGAAFAWNTAWTDQRLRARVLAVSLVAMTATLFAIAGVRWYFALAMLLATAVFFLHVSLRLTPRPFPSLAISALALFLLSRAFLAGAGPFVPAEVRAVLVPFASGSSAATPTWVVNMAQAWRERFIRSGGATSLAPPRPANVAAPEGTLPAVPVATPSPAPVASAPAAPVASAPAVPVATAPAAPAGSSPVTPVGSSPSPNEWVLGIAATFIPSSLQTTLGLPAISGGRGMLRLTDFDTIFFDIVMVMGLGSCLVAGRRLWSNSMLILVLLLTVVIGALMVYVVTNFGTLFRLRGMLLVTAALLPLAAASGLRRHSFGEERDRVARPGESGVAAPRESPAEQTLGV